MENFDPTETLKLKFGENTFTKQVTKDEILTLWVPLERVIEVLQYLKTEIAHPFPFLFDLTAIDERSRKERSRLSINKFYTSLSSLFI